MSITGKILKNVFSSWAYYFVQFSVGFLIVPFMIHRLGNDVYGIWVLVLSFGGYIGFFDFGIRGSIVKFVSEYEAKGDTEGLRKVINTSWVVHLIISCLILLLTIILSRFIHLFFKLDSAYINEFRICFILIGLNLGFTVGTSVFVSVLEGFKRQDIVSAVEIGAFIFQTLLIVISVYCHASLVVLGYIVFGVTLLKQVARAIFVYKIFPQFELSFVYFKKDFLSIILNYSFFLFIYQGMRNIIGSLPNIILGVWLGGAAITFYSIAARLVGYSSIFLSATSGILVPFVSGFDSLQDKKRLNKSFITGTKYSYMLAILLGVVLLVMGKPLINIWVGEEYAKISYPVLFITSIPFLLAPSAFVINAVLQGIGKLRAISFLALFELFIGIVLSGLFIKPFGIKGVALGLSIPYLINYGIILPLIIIKIIEVRLLDYLREVVIKIIIPAISLFVFLIIVKLNFFPSSLLILLVEVLAGALIYIVLCFHFSLNKEEKQFYLTKIGYAKFINLRS